MSNPLTGDLVADRYRLEGLIASGGMAQVWEGHDQVLDRKVALKILHPHLVGDATFVERFRHEAAAAGRLAHPSIVAVFDVCGGSEREVIVMELVRGESLRHYLNETTLADPAIVVPWSAQICDALEVAHSHGIVHRDIKPANILIVDDALVKVTDFGIAKATASADLTEVGMMMGTAKYLAPEQVAGEPVDGRGDVYSLGVVLYEALCGQVPFTGDSDTATALARLQRDAIPPRRIRPQLSPTLEATVLRMLARHPGDRFATAAQAGEALRSCDHRLGAVAPTTAPPATAPPTAVSPTAVSPTAPARPPVPPPAPPGHAARQTGDTRTAATANTAGARSASAPPPTATPRHQTRPVAPAQATGQHAPVIDVRATNRQHAVVGPPAMPVGRAEPRIARQANATPPAPNAVPDIEIDDPPPDEEAFLRDPRRVAGYALVTLVVVLALGVAGALFGRTSLGESIADGFRSEPDDDAPPADGTAAQGAEANRIAIVGGRTFDPPPGDGAEMDGRVPMAFDADPTTFWRTERYTGSVALGGRKDGVGLVVELAEDRSLDQVVIQSTRPGWDVEIYVSPNPGSALGDWGSPVGTATEVGQTTAITLDDASGKFVLLWITELSDTPGEDGRFLAEIAEITVT